MNIKHLVIIIFVLTSSCAPSPSGQTASPAHTSVDSPPATPAAPTFTALPTSTDTPQPTDTPLPTDTPTLTPLPTVENLPAKVIADKLSCRYGPGAGYIYLFAFNATTKVKLIGRTDANNWVWVASKNQNNRDNNCWVNAKFLEIQGDPGQLPIVYPGLKLPVSPYYPGPAWATAERREDGKVVISWEPRPISPGKYEDENMQQYIIEVWRCERVLPRAHRPAARALRAHGAALCRVERAGEPDLPEGLRAPGRAAHPAFARHRQGRGLQEGHAHRGRGHGRWLSADPAGGALPGLRLPRRRRHRQEDHRGEGHHRGPGAHQLHGRTQVRSTEHRQRYDVIVSRAVTTLPEFIRDTRHLVARGAGRIYYLKGGDLADELLPITQRYRVHALSEHFAEEFFATKKVVEIEM